jgi:hypothetical protein
VFTISIKNKNMTLTTFAPSTERAAILANPNIRLNASQEIWDAAAGLAKYQHSRAAKQIEAEGRVRKGQTPLPKEVYGLATANLRTKIGRSDPETTRYSELMSDRIALLVLEAPAATRAAAILRGTAGINPETLTRRAKDTTIGATRQFNLDLAETILDMKPTMVGTFPSLLHAQLVKVTEETGMPVFSAEMLNSRIGGVRRKVAAWRALRAELPEEYSIRQGGVKEVGRRQDLIISSNEGQVALGLLSTDDFIDELEKLASQREGRQRDGEPYIIDRDDGTIVIDADHFFGKLSRNDFDYDDPKLVSELVLDEFDRR